MSAGIVAVGHGRRDDGVEDPGAISVDGRWSEQSAGDYVVAEIGRQLRRQGVDAFDEAWLADPNYRGTVRLVNETGAPWVVAIHHDWHKGADVAYAYHHPKAKKAAGVALSDAIEDAIEASGLPVDRARGGPRGNLYLLNASNAPAVLVELGRIGSPNLDTPEELTAAGVAVARGIVAWLGQAWVEEDAEAPVVEVRAVAVTALREPDVTAARMLSLRHRFAFVEPDGDRGWTQVYPDGRRVPIDQIDYLVAVGWKRDDLVAQAGDGIGVGGANLVETLATAAELIADPAPPRRRPWAAD